MAAQEVVHPGVEVEAQEGAARVTQHHHEAHQRALRAPDPDLAEVGPVDLGLLAGQGLEAQIGLGHGSRPLGRDHVAEVALAPPVAALDRHLVEPGGGQPGPDRQGLADEGQERIDHRRPAPSQMHGLSGGRHRALDRGVMNAELAGDRADLPLLGVIQAQDLGTRLLVDGHLTPFVPGAGPDRPPARRTARSGGSGTPRRAAHARSAVSGRAPPAAPSQQDDAANGSKGDASLSALGAHPPAPGRAGVPDSGADGRHACAGPGGSAGSALRQGAESAGARRRYRAASSRCCRDRSAGTEPPGDGSKSR